MEDSLTRNLPQVLNNQISHDEVIQRSAENNSPDKSPLLTFSEVVTNTLLEDDG
jgi:hypothetical protein